MCVLCKERVGACIQCSVKTCKTAYHVTCAFKKGLEMRAIIEDENAEDGVKLRVSGVEKVSSTPCFVWFFGVEIPGHSTCGAFCIHFILLPFQSYCQKHSLNQKRRDSDDSDDEKLKKKNMTEEERDQAKHLK